MAHFNDAEIAKAVAAYKKHGSERKAAQALGISKTALHNRLQRADAVSVVERKPVGRPASTYRGARRNYARRMGALGEWRASAHHVMAANIKAKLYERSVMANAAREAAAKAAVEHGHQPAIIHAAYVAFYSGEKRTRVVNRILRDLGPLPSARAA